MGSRRAGVVLTCLALAIASCADDGDDRSEAPPADMTTTEVDPVALDAEAKGDVRNLASAVESCFVEQQDYSLCKEPPGAEAPLARVEVASAASYTVAATSDSGNEFRFERTEDGATSRECSEAGIGGCPPGGRW